MKKIICFFLSVVTFIACEKEGELPAQPSYATFGMTASSVNRYFEVALGDSLLIDSLSAQKELVNKYVVTGRQRLRIRDVRDNRKNLIDSLIDVQRPGVSFALVSLDEESAPLLLSGESLQTTPPEEGMVKLSFLNVDTTELLKGKKIDIAFYGFNGDDGSFEKKGELKGIEYMSPSEYIELKADGNTFFLGISDSETGEIILPVENFQALLDIPYDGKNVYMMKLYKELPDPSYWVVVASVLIGLKL